MPARPPTGSQQRAVHGDRVYTIKLLLSPGLGADTSREDWLEEGVRLFAL